MSDSNPDATYDKKYHTVTYSDFDANGNPLRKDYTDHLYATGSYFTFYTYDAQGNVLVEESWKPDLNSDDVNAKIPYLKYEYTYDENGIVLESLKSGKDWDTGEFVYESRETRTQISDLQYHFATYNYVASNDSWSERATKEEYYAMLDGDYAPLNIALSYVENVNFTNAVQLSCSVPATEVPNAQYIIWQDWQPVDTVSPFNGRISYVAQNLENGRDIEFMVQSYDAVNDVLYNASDVVVANFTIELPAVTNLHYVKTTEGTFTDGQGGTHPAYWVHFAWDAPETNLEIKHYNVYETGWAVPAKTTVNTCDSLSVYREKNFDSVDQQKQIGVQVSVEYVVGESEVVTQTFDIEHTGLVNVNVADAYVDGNMLYANAVADVVIYNVAGVAVINRNEVTTLELDALPAGAYVAAVRMEGKLQVVKFVR